MGQEIVYCATCQTRLRGNEFETGEAFRHHGQAFCPACVPEEARSPAPAPKETPPRKSTRSIPLATVKPKTTRYAGGPARHGSKTPILVGAGIFAGIIILIIAAASGSSRTNLSNEEAAAPDALPPPVEKRSVAAVEHKPAPPRTPPPGRERRVSPDDVIRELEIKLASAEDPTAILMKCEQVRPMLLGTPQAARLKEIEAQAMRMKAAAGGDRKLDLILKDLREILRSEGKFEREEEVRGMLRAALASAGSRRAEIDKLRRDYDASIREERNRIEAGKPGPPVVVKFYLYDIEAKKPVAGFNPLKDGAVVDLSKLPAKLEIRAAVRGPNGKSVRFDLDGRKYSTENNEPYEFDGGAGGAKSWASKAGKHTLKATPYSKGSLKGVAGKPQSVTITVIRP